MLFLYGLLFGVASTLITIAFLCLRSFLQEKNKYIEQLQKMIFDLQAENEANDDPKKNRWDLN